MLSTLQGPSQTMEEISPFFTIPLDSLSSQNVLQDIVIKNVSDDSIAINNNQKENTTIIFLDDLELLPAPIAESKEEPKPSANKRKLKIEASTNISKYKCFKCFEQFYSLNMYRQHMTWHRNIKKYKCLNCSAGYNNENNFKIHMAMHMQGKPKCPICEASFQRLASLKSHLMMHQEEELFNCDDCKAEFDKEDDLIKHMEIHMTNKAKENQPLTCPYCKIDYEDTISYKEHISYHIKVKKLLLKGKRAKKLRPITGSGFACTKCKKTFTKMSLLDRHERIHSGEKPYVCQYCNRGFTQKGTLQIHLRNHTGLKPFKCTLCPAKFNQKGNLRVHIEKTHTAPSTGQVYKCSACNCIFKKVASLNGHMTKVHNDTSEINSVIQKLKQLDQFSKVPETAVENIDPGIIMKPHNSESYIRLTESWHDGSIRRYSVKRKIVGDVRWYCCQFCSKECKKPSDLIRHIRIHTKEKPFECTLCNASFALKATMLGHIKTHSKQSLLKCNKCDQGFYSKRSLLKHQKKHTAVFNPQYQCSLCRKVFNNFDAANQHRKEHSDQNTDDCIKLVLKQPLFQTQNGPSQTKAPKQKVTNTELQSQRPHHCTICNGRFTRLVNLQRHLKVHENDRSFKCTLCPKAFVSGYKLKEHLKFHSNVREFKCELCNKQFVTSYLLKRHLLTHNDSRPYNCQYCDKNFKTAILARMHILKLHKKKVSLQALEMYHKNGDENVKCVESKSDNPPPDTIPNLIIGTEIAEEIAEEPEVEVPSVQENQPQVFEIPNTILSNDLITTDGQELSEDFSQIYQTVYVNCENLEDPNFSTNILSQLEQGSSEELLNNTQNTVVFNIDSIDMQNTEINQILKQNANFPNQENIDIVVHNLNMNPTINFNANEENKVYYYEYDTTTSELKNSFLVTEDNKIAETLDITCTVCDNKFDQMTNFKDHNCVALAPVEKVKEKEEKAKSKPEFQCNICKRKMNSRISYYKHVSSHDRSKLNPNACCICQKVFKKPSDLTRHIRTHTGEKPFGCEKCDKKFALKSTLASHMRSHDPENSKKFKCEICNSLFSFKSSLTTHMRIHSGKKPYNCNFCSATFRTPAHKSLHESTNHILKTKKKSKEKITTLLESVASEVVANVEEGMKNNAVLMNQSEQMLGQDSLNMLNITVPDNISDQIQIDPVILLQELQSSGVLIQDGIGDNDMISTSILQLDDLTLLNLKNIGIEENEKPSPEKTRNFECDECHKMYASKDVLRKHKKIHNRVKQFPCTKCSKGFDNEDEWNVHVLTHHNGLRPFTCAFCSNSFARENNLRTHMKRIHDISNI